MGRKTELLSTGVIGEINLTPLMDLTFILLITFIITFPLLESGLPVNLPTAEGDPLEEKETVSVSVVSCASPSIWSCTSALDQLTVSAWV